jgi:hypothetical protein
MSIFGKDDPWANKPSKYSYIPKTDKNSPEYKQTSRWLDILLEGSNDAPSEDFEIDQPNNTTMSVTTSSNPKRPRTLKAGYNHSTQTLTVVFRDGTWWEYRDVPEFMWYDFQQAESKGAYLRESGLDSWTNDGKADIDNMPKSQRVQLNNYQEFVDYMYGPKPKRD